MSAQHNLGPSPEHFELMRGALDHIARTARKSRSMTRRLRWIEQRAEFAIRGEVYSSEKLNLPKSAGPDTPEKLQKRLSAITVQRDELLGLLKELMDTELAELACEGSHAPIEDLLGRIKSTIAKAEGGAA